MNVVPQLIKDTYTMERMIHHFGEQLVARAVSEPDCDEVVLVFDRETLFHLGTVLVHYANLMAKREPS